MGGQVVTVNSAVVGEGLRMWRCGDVVSIVVAIKVVASPCSRASAQEFMRERNTMRFERGTILVSPCHCVPPGICPSLPSPLSD